MRPTGKKPRDSGTNFSLGRVGTNTPLPERVGRGGRWEVILGLRRPERYHFGGRGLRRVLRVTSSTDPSGRRPPFPHRGRYAPSRRGRKTSPTDSGRPHPPGDPLGETTSDPHWRTNHELRDGHLHPHPDPPSLPGWDGRLNWDSVNRRFRGQCAPSLDSLDSSGPD